MNSNNASLPLLNLQHIEAQGAAVSTITENRFGKNTTGFCDYALDGVELLFQSLYFIDRWELDDKGDYKNKQSAVLFLTFMHIHRVSHSFLSVYKLFLQGYYTESTVLLRPIIESLVRLKYVNKNGDIEDINKILLGFGKTSKEKYNVRYSTMFNAISKDLYFLYTLLCDFSHSGLLSHIPKFNKYPKEFKSIVTGLEYNEEAAGLIANQLSIYLLSHLELLSQIFPNFTSRMPADYASKYYATLSIFWKLLSQISEANNDGTLYNAAKKLIEY